MPVVEGSFAIGSWIAPVTLERSTRPLRLPSGGAAAIHFELARSAAAVNRRRR